MRDKRTKAELIRELAKEKNDNASLRNTMAGLQSGMTYLNTECDNANDRTQQEKAKTAHFERLFHEQQTRANAHEQDLIKAEQNYRTLDFERCRLSQANDALQLSIVLVRQELRIAQKALFDSGRLNVAMHENTGEIGLRWIRWNETQDSEATKSIDETAIAT